MIQGHLTKVKEGALKYHLWPLLLGTLFVSLVYSNIFFSPNSYLLNIGGDAFKNYYTYIYHIKNGINPFHFKGLNYPFGENIFFPDALPVLSIPLKYFSFLQPYSIGIFNWAIFFSFILGIVFLYLIFKKFKVHWFWAGVFALGVQLLTPQMLRMLGHFSLSYSCFIPIGWYMLLVFSEKKNKLRWSFLMALQVVFWFMFHPYLGLIISAFYLFFWCFRILIRLFRRELDKGDMVHGAIQSLLPILFFKLLVSITDIHGARAENPYGFYMYAADWDTVFFPFYWGIKGMFESIGYKTTGSWEGDAYIGIMAVLAIVLMTGVFFWLVKKRKLSKIYSLLSKEQFLFAFSATVLLLFAMCIPFKWDMDFLLDLPVLKILKQFRSTGRFAWMFYYVIAVLSLVVYYNCWLILKRKGFRILSYVALLLPITILFSEGIYNQKLFARRIEYSPNLFFLEELDKDVRNAINKINGGDYQAILPIPFFHYGAGTNSRLVSGDAEGLPQILSFYTSLPMFAYNLPRGPIDQSAQVLEILSKKGPKRLKPLLSHNQPILIVKLKNIEEPILAVEQEYIAKANKVFENEKVELWSIDVNNFCSPKELPNRALSYKNLRDSLFRKGDFWLSDTTSFFDHDFVEPTFFKNHEKDYPGLNSDGNQYKFIRSYNPGDLPLGNYVVSFWHKPNDPLTLDVSFIVEKKDADGGNVQWPYGKGLMKIYNHLGEWSFFELPITIDDTTKAYNLLLRGGDDPKKNLYKIVNFQMRQLPLNTYLVSDPTIFNNYFFNY